MELKQYNLFFLYQETFALTKRLFIQLKRRPSTLLAGILKRIKNKGSVSDKKN
jgi:ABC-2 type transport system permease protein